MKYVLSPTLVTIANRVAKIPGFKKMLKPIYYPYKEYLNKKRNAEFRKNGLEVLRLFDKILVENDFHYSVFAGTLLGAIREKSFLKHDMDIDTALFYDEYSPKLQESLENGGFKLIHRFAIENGEKGMEETYLKDNISIDIFYIYKDENFPTYQCDFNALKGCKNWEQSMEKYGYVGARRIEFPVSRKVKRVPIDSILVNAIDNAEEWLECRYGSDYMIPNPNFTDKGDNPRMRDWESVKAVYTIF